MRKTQKRQSKKLIKNIGGGKESGRSGSRSRGSRSISKSVGSREINVYWVEYNREFEELQSDIDFTLNSRLTTAKINVTSYTDPNLNNKITKSWENSWGKKPTNIRIIYKYYTKDDHVTPKYSFRYPSSITNLHIKIFVIYTINNKTMLDSTALVDKLNRGA